MFRLLPAGLPADPHYPADLDELGYFITDTGQIKSKANPTDDFQYYITDNQRYNDAQREAMHTCISREVMDHLGWLNVQPLYLPQLTIGKPEGEQHLPILTTSEEQLSKKKSVIVMINCEFEDLAIWSYRVLCKEGIDAGSAVLFVKQAIARANTIRYYNRLDKDSELSKHGHGRGRIEPVENRESVEGNDVLNKDVEDEDLDPGIIIMNPGQLLYSHRHAKAMTPTSWNAQPRKSAVHPPPTIHPVLNHIPGNGSAFEHIAFVFENIIGNYRFISKDCKVFLVGIGDGGNELVNFLDANWANQSSRIAALALTGPGSVKATDASFLNFLRDRTRAWIVSNHLLDTPLANSTKGLPLQQVSGGDGDFVECIMPIAYDSILHWFSEVERAGPGYKNEALEIPEEVCEEAEDTVANTADVEW